MYTIKDLTTIMDIVSYTVSAMRESAYIDSDIDDYIDKISSENNYSIIQISKEILNDCNSIENYDSSDYFEDTWRDSYYSSLWDDSIEDTFTNNKAHFYDDNEDVYEGFNSCGGRCDDSEWELKGYYNPEIHSKFEDDDF